MKTYIFQHKKFNCIKLEIPAFTLKLAETLLDDLVMDKHLWEIYATK